MGIHTDSLFAAELLLDDPVTGFGGRRKLLHDLEDAVRPESAETLLVILGLDGLSEHREVYGRLESHRLLALLAGRLAAAVDGSGRCYRAREDEFVVLVDTPIAGVMPVLDACVAALRERGRYFLVTAAFGAAMLPGEASGPLEALALADRRLSSNAPRRQPRNRRRRRR